MIITYLRSSSLGTFEICEMQYFFQYVLGMKNKTNKKALLGTIFHRVMQVLADKKIAQTNKKRTVKNDDIPNLTFAQADNIEYVTELCFNYYQKTEPEITLNKQDLKMCTNWVYKALSYNDGSLDPRNQNIYMTEKFFDIEIKQDWAKYYYNVNNKSFDGYLAIKGTIDLIIKENDAYFQILDYKTGRRFNWATGEEKTYEDLCSDKQLLLYYYALKNLYPDINFYVSIYYVNDGGIFDIVFGESDYIKAENMLKKYFNHIRSIWTPKQISQDQSHWKCSKLCKFSDIDPKTGETICKTYHDMIDLYGIDYVVNNHANLDKINTYGSGGGRIAEN